jgi:competence protein ComEC
VNLSIAQDESKLTAAAGDPVESSTSPTFQPDPATPRSRRSAQDRFRTRPALSLTLLLAAGISIHPLLPHNAAALLAMTGVIAALAAVTLQRRIIGSAFLTVSIVLCGAALAQREHFQYPATQIGLFAGDEPRLADVQLRLLDEPQIIASSFGQVRPLPPKQVVWAEVLKIKTWNGWTDASGQTVLQIDQPHPRLAAGQIVRVFGMLQRPPAAMNPGQFDWADYYREQRVLVTLTAARAANVEVLDEPRLPPLLWLRLSTRRVLERGFTAARTTEHALLRALLLGDHDPQLRDVQNEFQQTGVGYQLSVSGLHVIMLAGFLLGICRALQLRPRWSLPVSTAFVVLYALVALPSQSGTRAAIGWIVVALATLTRRHTDRFQVLALAIFAMLLWHPLDLYSGGFQLSVIAVCAIVLLLPRVRELLLSWRDPDIVAAGDLLAPPPPLESALARVLAAALRTMEFVLIAWLATLPFIAWRFGQFDPWSLLAAGVLLPVVFVAMIGGLMKILFTLLWPIAAGTWANAAAIPVVLLRHLVDWLARLPGARVPLAAPPMWVIVVYYSLLLLPLLRHIPMLTGRRRWFVRLAPLAGVAGIFLLPSVPQAQHATEAPTLRVTLLSLGAGQCAVIEPPGGQPILFDAGSSSIGDIVHKLVGPFLRSEGRREVDKIFLSHGDYDHMCAAGEIATAYGVHEMLMSPHFRRNAEGNLPDEALLDLLDNKLDLPPHVIASGDHVDLGGGATVDVLWPPLECNENSNNTGLVLRLSYAGKRILFPADIQDPAFAGVLAHTELLAADVLVAPHHGSFESLTPAFVRAVHPSEIVASSAWRLTNKQKHFDELAAALHTPMLRTNQYGAITILVTSDGQISVSTYLHPQPPAAAQTPGP